MWFPKFNGILAVLVNPFVKRVLGGGLPDLWPHRLRSDQCQLQMYRLDLNFTGITLSLLNHTSPPCAVLAAFRTVHNFEGRSQWQLLN